MRIKRKIRRDIQFAKSMTLPQWIIGLILLFGIIFVLILLIHIFGCEYRFHYKFWNKR